MGEWNRVEHHWKQYPLGLGRLVPDTPGWRELHLRRTKQLRRTSMKGECPRWRGAKDLVQSGYLVPNFTRLGFEIVQTPEPVRTMLHDHLIEGLPHAVDEVMDPQLHQMLGTTPRFIPGEKFNNDIMRRLKPVHEKWSGVELIPSAAYGLRIYQNDSTLHMHHDNVHSLPCATDDNPSAHRRAHTLIPPSLGHGVLLSWPTGRQQNHIIDRPRRT